MSGNPADTLLRGQRCLLLLVVEAIHSPCPRHQVTPAASLSFLLKLPSCSACASRLLPVACLEMWRSGKHVTHHKLDQGLTGRYHITGAGAAAYHAVHAVCCYILGGACCSISVELHVSLTWKRLFQLAGDKSIQLPPYVKRWQVFNWLALFCVALWLGQSCFQK